MLLPTFSLADRRIFCLTLGNWIIQFHLVSLTVRCYSL
jgi:hypothetical protein